MLVGVNDLQLRSGKIVTSENQKQPMVIINEKGEEKTTDHSEKDDTIQPIPIRSEPFPSSSNRPPYPEGLVVKKNDPIPKYSLASKLINLFIKVPLLQDIKEIPNSTKIVRELFLKKPWRRRLESQTIQFVGRAAELMIGCMHMEKYINLGNPIVSV